MDGSEAEESEVDEKLVKDGTDSRRNPKGLADHSRSLVERCAFLRNNLDHLIAAIGQSEGNGNNLSFASLRTPF